MKTNGIEMRTEDEEVVNIVETNQQEDKENEAQIEEQIETNVTNVEETSTEAAESTEERMKVEPEMEIEENEDASKQTEEKIEKEEVKNECEEEEMNQESGINKEDEVIEVIRKQSKRKREIEAGTIEISRNKEKQIHLDKTIDEGISKISKNIMRQERTITRKKWRRNPVRKYRVIRDTGWMSE